MKLNSHLTFSNSQRGGILVLIFLIFALLCIFYFVNFSGESHLDNDSSEIIALQSEMDSLAIVEIESQKPKIYPFNPNFITDFKGYTLGMSNDEIDRLLNYRQEGKWINSTADFKKVTNVSDSLLNVISPYFKFPEWVNNPKPSFPKNNTESFKNYSGPKLDLNTATEEQLIEVYGIGEALSKRIIAYREKLGGFSDDRQLYNVFGLNEEVVKKIQERFTVKTPKKIEKMNINKVSASDIATVPGITFELAKKIWEFRKLHEGIQNFSELSNIEGLSQRKLDEIQLYLYIE